VTVIVRLDAAWWPAAFIALGLTLTVAWGGILVWGVVRAAMWLAA
jgi:hypothetical protein